MSETSQELLWEFMDAAVVDRAKALQMLAHHPALRHARRAHIDETALHYLVVEHQCDAVRFLAENGFDVNAISHDGSTPLMSAALLGDLSMARLLLSLGANPNVTSDTWDTVICAGVSSGNHEMVRLLLEAGANPQWVPEFFTWRDYLPDKPHKREAILAIMKEFGQEL